MLLLEEWVQEETPQGSAWEPCKNSGLVAMRSLLVYGMNMLKTGWMNSLDTFVRNMFFLLKHSFGTVLATGLDHLLKNYNLKWLQMAGKEEE